MNNAASPAGYNNKLSLCTWKSLYATLAFIFTALITCGQIVTVEVGTGTTTANNIPITAYYGYSYSQQIYTATDISLAGGVPANIQKIRFYLSSANFPVNNSSNWTIYMGNSPHSEFTSNTDWEPLGNLTEVYSGDIIYPNSGNNWVAITLSGSFTWDGVSNIIVAVHESAPGFASGNVNWNVTGTGSSSLRSIYYLTDINNPDPASLPTATGRSVYVPNIQFDFEQIPCAGIIPNPGSTIASQESLCGADNPIMLNLQNNYGGYSDISYQWQASPNGVSDWEDVDNGSGLSLATVPVNTTFYRALVTCANNQAASIPVAVTMHSLPSVSVNVDTVVYCDGTNATLTASGAASYIWSPAADLNIDTGALVAASPSLTTLYTVTGTDTFGCQNTATATVIPMSSYAPQDIIPTINICNGAPASISVTALTDENDNPLEYELTDTAGNIIVPWQANTLFEFTPSEEGRSSILPVSAIARMYFCS